MGGFAVVNDSGDVGAGKVTFSGCSGPSRYGNLPLASPQTVNLHGVIQGKTLSDLDILPFIRVILLRMRRKAQGRNTIGQRVQ